MRDAGPAAVDSTSSDTSHPVWQQVNTDIEKLPITVFLGDDESIGHTLSDLNLKIMDQLGAGTFGTVHAAWCEQSQTEVAVKIVGFDDADLEDDRLCFVKEVAAMKALGDSRYIVRLQRGALDRDQQSGVIVMERADGPDLDAYLQNQDDPLPAQEALWIGLRVAKAVGIHLALIERFPLCLIIALDTSASRYASGWSCTS